MEDNMSNEEVEVFLRLLKLKNRIKNNRRIYFVVFFIMVTGGSVLIINWILNQNNKTILNIASVTVFFDLIVFWFNNRALKNLENDIITIEREERT